MAELVQPDGVMGVFRFFGQFGVVELRPWLNQLDLAGVFFLSSCGDQLVLWRLLREGSAVIGVSLVSM